MKVVVILPTYNERENILTLLQALNQSLQTVKNHTVSYLIVDDESPDGTGDIVRTYAQTHKNVFLLSGKKEGLGKALLRGMTYVQDTMHADIVVQMDADLSHDPTLLPLFITAIDNGADFIVGSRYIKGGSIPNNWGLHRKLFSIFGNAIVRFGLGYPRIHDWTGGYRAYRKEFIDLARKNLRKYSGYVFQIAFLHLSILYGAKIVEIPIHFTDRKFGHSKIAPAQYIKNVFEYVIQARFHEVRHGTFGKFLVVGTIAFTINTILLEFFVHYGLHPTYASIGGAEIAMICNFMLNNSWTFRSKKITGIHMLHKFFQFNVTSIGAIGIQAGAIAIGTHIYGVASYRLFYVMGVGVALFYNYIMYSKIIWKAQSTI